MIYRCLALDVFKKNSICFLWLGTFFIGDHLAAGIIDVFCGTKLNICWVCSLLVRAATAGYYSLMPQIFAVIGFEIPELHLHTFSNFFYKIDMLLRLELTTLFDHFAYLIIIHLLPKHLSHLIFRPARNNPGTWDSGSPRSSMIALGNIGEHG